MEKYLLFTQPRFQAKVMCPNNLITCKILLLNSAILAKTKLKITTLHINSVTFFQDFTQAKLIFPL